MEIIVGILLIVLINLAIWYLAAPIFVERKMRRFQNELIDKQYKEVESIYRKMRGWRHDYHNHIQVLKAYMTMNQYKQAQEYLDKLEEDLTTIDTMIKTGNIMVDAILNSKLTLIQEKHIKVNATAVVPQNIAISDVDLSVIIGNLLDNAIEACMQVPEEQDRFIRVYIDVIKKQLYISVTNSMIGKGKKHGNYFYSMKQGNHGFGLLRIDNIVEKYHGYLNRQSEEGIFATEVMLPFIHIQ